MKRLEASAWIGLAAFALLLIVIVALVAVFGFWPEEQAAKASAIWTEIYAVGSLFQLLGLGAAAFFAFKAWRSSQEQVEQAKRSAMAAERSVEVSQENGRLQLRCYPAIQDVRIGFGNYDYQGIVVLDPPEDQLPHHHFPILRFVVRNHGASPMLDFSFRLSFKYGAHFFQDGLPVMVERQGARQFPFPRGEMVDYGEIIPASEQHEFSFLCRFRTDELEAATLSAAVGQGSLNIVVVIALTYRDVFRQRHTEEHCYSATVAGGPLTPLAPMSRVPILFFETQRELQRIHGQEWEESTS